MSHLKGLGEWQRARNHDGFEHWVIKLDTTAKPGWLFVLN